MASINSFRILVLLTVLCAVNSSKLIYRRYEKKHHKKNYIQVIEIFESRQAPPLFSENDRDLNDFLAKDSYKTDMNCSKANQNGSETVLPPLTEPIVTTLPTIPTTASRRPLTTPWVTSTQTPRFTPTRSPNLNNLFTIRPTKPTIRPNPRENENPDYTELIPDQKLNVQVTKHRTTRMPQIIVIQETDDYPTTNLVTLAETDVERDTLSTEKFPFTSTTELQPNTTTEKSYDEEIIYSDSGEELGPGDDYNEDNYPDVIPPDQVEPTDDTLANYSDADDYDDDEEGENFNELKKRRKRQKIKRTTPLKSSHTKKT